MTKMQLTLEQKAWQLWENGLDYGGLATNANVLEVSIDKAIEILWEEKFGK